MLRIWFLLGKFKFWLPDPFQTFKIFCYSALKCLTIFEDGVELNWLDGVQRKTS
ncbi:hypothetical protein Hanom_Chr13g01217201 [Helianthus anomalus]